MFRIMRCMLFCDDKRRCEYALHEKCAGEAVGDVQLYIQCLVSVKIRSLCGTFISRLVFTAHCCVLWKHSVQSGVFAVINRE